MPAGTGYPIEDFLEAITAQLDQTQDALRLKAVNRPLTFALKDFNVDLKVFVEMDQQGRVTFRPAGPNEEGASTVSIGFTTITRPMIEENTISMEMAQAPTLDELGLARDEQRQLAKIGVRNAAQLRRLQRSAGEETLSRNTGVDLGRIRAALNLARPRLDEVGDEPAGKPAEKPVASAPWPGATPRAERPEMRPEIRMPRGDGGNGAGAGGAEPRRSSPVTTPDRGNLAARLREGLGGRGRAEPAAESSPAPRRLEIAPGARSIRIAGRNLTDAGRAPEARLDGRPLTLLDATSLAASFALPPGRGDGRLTIELPDGATQEFDMVERDATHGPLP